MPLVALVFSLIPLAGFPGAEEYLRGHDAERTAHYDAALSAYTACAGIEGPLAPYARVKAAYCRGAAGDAAGAIEEYGRLLEQGPDGPWRRMARMYLAALLASRKNYPEASVAYAQALEFEPKPRWIDPYRWAAAECFIETPDFAAKGFDFYRDVIAATPIRDTRLKAARQLVKSARVEDKLAAAWGMVKSSECGEALPVLIGLGPALAGNELSAIDWSALAVAAKKKGAKPNDLAPVGQLAGVAAGNAWMRAWLVCVARSETASGGIDVAQECCDLLAKGYPGCEELGEALWWLGGRLAKDGKKPEAIGVYLRLAEQCPKHSRADDALLAAADLQRALGPLEAFAKTVQSLAERYPESSLPPKAWYGLGCAYDKAGNKKNAADAFRKAAAHGPGNFYAHRALQRLAGGKDQAGRVGKAIPVDGAGSFLRAFPRPTEPLIEAPEGMRTTPYFERLVFFGMHGIEEGEWEAVDLAAKLKEGPEAAALYAALGEAGLALTAMNYADAFTWGVNDGHPSTARRRVSYPRGYWPEVLKIGKEAGVDPYLVLAVARQESMFRPAIKSYAGATGVMQLMPGTAKHLAQKNPHITPEHAADLESPANSLRLGAYYLRSMLDRSKGNLVFALASYNAGPGNCDKWRAKFGSVDMETFIDSIPFFETREYVKIVLGNYAAYYSLYPPVE